MLDSTGAETILEKRVSESDDRRDAERIQANLKLSISLETAGGGLSVTPASIQDISRNGVLVSTRRELNTLQDLMIAIPSNICPGGMQLPEAFIGPAMVVRVDAPKEQDRYLVALRFGDGLSNNVQFISFLDFLQTKAEATAH